MIISAWALYLIGLAGFALCFWEIHTLNTYKYPTVDWREAVAMGLCLVLWPVTVFMFLFFMACFAVMEFSKAWRLARKTR